MSKKRINTGFDYNLVVNGNVYATATLPEKDDAKARKYFIEEKGWRNRLTQQSRKDAVAVFIKIHKEKVNN